MSKSMINPRVHFWLILVSFFCIATSAQAAKTAYVPQKVNRKAANSLSAEQAISEAARGVYTRATGASIAANPVASMTILPAAQNGEWSFRIEGGDPTTKDDDNYDVIQQSGAYLYVDGKDTEFQIGTGGQWVKPPYVNQFSQTGGWIWKTDDPLNAFTVELKLKLIRDVLTYEYDITNNNANYRRAGFRLWMDDDYLKDPGGPYYLPNYGQMTTEEELVGDKIPDYWFVRYGTPLQLPDYHPPLMYKQIFTGDNTTPAELIFGELGGAQNNVDQYGWPQIIAGQNATNSASTMTFQSGIPLNPGTFAHECVYKICSLGIGQTQIVRGQIQLNWSQVNTSGLNAVAVRAPEWVSTQNGTNDIQVDGYVCNSGQLFNVNANVSITVGSGLELSPGQTQTYMNQTIPMQVDKPFHWFVRPNGKACGLIPIMVSASFSTGESITSTTYINVPALPNRNFEIGTHFIGIPFDFTDPRPTAVFPGLGTDTRLAWYDATIGDYHDGVNDDFALTPGQGYWLKTTSPLSFSSADAAPIDQRSPYLIQLNKGWNSISNPYQFSIVWGLCGVMYNYDLYPISKAISMGLVRAELWSWDEQNEEYNPPTNPTPDNALAMELKPNVGYWLYAGERVTLVYMPNPYIAVMNPDITDARSQRLATLPTDQWRVNIIARTSNAVDRYNTFGIGSPIGTKSASGDIMKAPMSPSGLSAYFPHSDFGTMSGNYAVDLQAVGNRHVWKFAVNCIKPNEQISLNWLNVAGIPAALPVIMTDQVTGKAISMRSSTSYSFNSGKGGIRNFTITVGGPVVPLKFTKLQATSNRQSGSVILTVGLNSAATVAVSIRTAAGRVIRTLSPVQAPNGLSTIIWDGKDAQGKLQPRGLYFCDFTAEATDGQCIRSSIMVSKQ